MDNQAKKKRKGLFSFLSNNMCLGGSCSRSAPDAKPEHKTQKSWFGIIAAVIVIGLMVYNSIMDNRLQKEREAELKIIESVHAGKTLNEENYSAVEYIALIKKADDFRGKKIKLSGELVKEIDLTASSRKNNYLFMAIENNQSVGAIFLASLEKELTIKAGDKLELFGEYWGRKEIDDPALENNNIPWLNVEYYQLD